MIRLIFGCISAIAASVSLPTETSAEVRIRLTPEQRAQALSLVANNEVFKSTPTKRRVLCELLAVRRKLPDGREVIQVTTYHFEYKDGVAIKSVLDLTAGKVLQMQKLEAYSPPLAPEERTRALELAISKAPSVRALYDNNVHIHVEYLPTVVSDRKSELFGHRLVHMNFLPKQATVRKSVRVKVDLTAETILKMPLGGKDSNGELPDPAETIEQFFPIRASDDHKQTGWRIRFATTMQGSGEILYIQEASFKRSKEEPWIQVLADCRLAEMFVGYNDGNSYYDITGVGGTLEQLHDKHFGPDCLGPGRLYLNDKVAREFHDGKNLWYDHWPPCATSRRVEEIHLWAVLPTGNYAYPMLYVFRADGSIGFYVAATAHNLSCDTSDDATHLHTGCWRINIALGDQSKNRIETVRRKASSALGAKAETVIEPFNYSKEGGIVWNADDMLRARVTSQFVINSHKPPHPVGYELVPIRHGNGRRYGEGEEWTHNDLWVTLPECPSGGIRDRFKELPTYVKDPRSIEAKAAVIWYHTSLVHRARDEDFGKVASDPAQGVALSAWTGFELVPRNLFSQTPLYP